MERHLPHPIAWLPLVKSWKFAMEVTDTSSETVAQDVQIRNRFFEKIVDNVLSQEFGWTKTENREVFIEKVTLTQRFV